MWSFSFSKNFSGFSSHQMKSLRALVHSQCLPSNDPRFLLPSPHFRPWLSSENHSHPLEGTRTCCFLCLSSLLWQFQDSLSQHSSDLSINVLATPSLTHTFKLKLPPTHSLYILFFFMLFSIRLCISTFIFLVEYFHNFEYKLHEYLKRCISNIQNRPWQIVFRIFLLNLKNKSPVQLYSVFQLLMVYIMCSCLTHKTGYCPF